MTIAQSDRMDALLSAAIEDPAQRYAFYASLLELELLVIGTVADEATLHLKYIEMDGERVLPVYTSWSKFDSVYASRYPYVKIPARMLLDMVELSDAWVLNPGFEPCKRLVPEELRTLQDGTILDYYWDQLSPQEMRTRLEEQTTAISDQSLLTLTRCLQAIPSIRAAYLARVYKPSDHDKPYPLVGLEMDAEDREAARLRIKVIYETVRQQLRLEPAIEFMLLDDAISMSRSMKERLQPFYTRSPIEDIRSLFH